MIRRPPRSPLLPYTTLFRSVSRASRCARSASSTTCAAGRRRRRGRAASSDRLRLLREKKRMQIAADAVASWSTARPEITGEFRRDADAHSKFWREGYDLLAALPEKPKRNPGHPRAAEPILPAGR